MQSLKGLKVAVLATDGFEQVELTEPVKALKEAEAEVVIVAPEEGKIQGFKHFDKADTFDVDQSLSEADADEFDALVLPGGALNADDLRTKPEVKAFLKAFDEAGKPMASICHAPWSLISAGLVGGRKLTSYHAIQDDIRNAGGEWVDEEVVIDRNWVTSRQPDDLPAFNEAMVGLFASRRDHKSSRRHDSAEHRV